MYRNEDDDELAFYTSLEESKPCCLCGRDTEDVVKFGKKNSVRGITAHHFCLLLSSNLHTNDAEDAEDDDDDNDMFGFALDDIKIETRRAAKLVKS